jgi:hypothetical protein
MTDETTKIDDIIDIEPQVIADEPTDIKQARPKRGLRNAGIGVLLALLCATAGGWIYRQTLSNYFPNDQVAALSARLDGVEAINKDSAKRVDAVIALTDELKSKLSAALAAAEKSQKIASTLQGQSDGMTNDLSTLKQNLATAQSGLDEIKTKLANGVGGSATVDPALAARIATLEKNLAAQGAAPIAPKLDIATLANALNNMKVKIDEGQGFQFDFDIVKKLAPMAEGLDVLGSAAQMGASNGKQLAAEIESVVAKLPKAEIQPTAPEGWMDKIGSYFSGLVSVKPLGASEINTAAQKAAAFAASGDLPQALDVLDMSEAALTPDLQRWHEKVALRIAIEQAIEKTSTAVNRMIAAKG